MHSSPFRALTHYRVLPATLGWPALVIAFLARAPFAMVPLGTMTAVSASTGSVATGGLATAVVSLTSAVAAPLIGRASDRWGQRIVLAVLVPLNALALAVLSWAVLAPWQGPGLLAACFAVGATVLPIGSFTRARWVTRMRTPHDLGAAFSYESMADEATFVLGPALVGLASASRPAAPLLLATALVVLAGVPFALGAPRSEPRDADVPHDSGPRPSILTVLLRVAPAVVVMASIGTFFGAVQAGTTQRAVLLGNPAAAGLVYALMGIGSALMSLAVVALPDAWRLHHRILLGGGVMSLCMAAVSAVSSLGATAAFLALTGFFVGPTMVSAFTVAERRAPAGGTAVAMTALSGAVTVGVSAGSALGGWLAQGDPAHAYLFASAASIVIVLVALGAAVSGHNPRHTHRGRMQAPVHSHPCAG